jgi:hypothetical protein
MSDVHCIPITSQPPGDDVGEIGLVFDYEETHVSPRYDPAPNRRINTRNGLTATSMDFRPILQWQLFAEALSRRYQ